MYGYGPFGGPGGPGSALDLAIFSAPLTTSVALARGGYTPSFTRATEATVVDFEGLVKTCKSGELRFSGARRVSNLVVDSEDFTIWDNSNTTDSGNTITATAGNGTLTDTFTAIAADYVFSCKLRRVTGTGNIQIAADSGTWTTVTLTDSYQRFSVQQTLTAGSKSFGIRIVTSGDAVDIDEAQLELVAGQANQNPSEYVSIGVLSSPYHGAMVDGVKYFDYENGNTVASNVVTEAQGSAISATTLKGVLIEKQSTNIATYSNDLTTGWVAFRSTWTTGQTTGPTGVANSAGLWAITGTGYASMSSTKTVTAAVNYTMSIFGKAGTEILHSQEWRGTGSAPTSEFNLSTGAITVDTLATARIRALANSWYRCSQTAVSNDTSEIAIFSGSLSSPQIGDTLYWYGAQIEQSSYPTSYISSPVGSATTRNADPFSYNLTLAVNDISLSVHWTPQASSTTTQWIIGSYSDANNYTALLYSGGNLIFRKRISGTNYDATIACSATVNTTYKIAARLSSSSGVDIWLNGTKGTGTADLSSGVHGSSIGVGQDGNSANQTAMNIKELQYFSKALTDAQLAGLSS